MHKFYEWTGRYLPLEITGTVAALIGGSLSNQFFPNIIINALVATWSENIGFYGFACYKIFVSTKRSSSKSHKNIRYLSITSITFRNLILEFGIAESLDSFVIRPSLMTLFQFVTNNFYWGILIGKITADLIFYLFAILGYEAAKKFNS